jgi:hypothetical protein
MKTLPVCIALLWYTGLSAQTIKCPKEDCGRFQTFINAAQNAARKPDFNQAIIQYNAARVCCPSATEAIDAEILKVFELIENQRKMADANAERAQKAEVRTKKALDKAERLIGFFGFTQNRAWAYKNGKFAVIDRDGKQWTGFEFEDPDTFQRNGYAIARRSGFYLFVDTLGKTCQEYDYLFPTNRGFYKVRKDKKYTFVDFRGIPLPGMDWYESIDTFSSGLAIVRKKEKCGAIDIQGREVIKPEFASIGAYTGGMAWAKKDFNDNLGIIDRTGRWVVSPEFSNGFFIRPGVSYAQKPGKWGMIDKAGKIVVQPEYDRISDFENGLAIVLLKDKYGAINTRGELVIPPRFDILTDFSEGLAPAELDSLRGYIDTTGATAIPFRFEKTNSFSQGLAAVKVNKIDKWGYIDKTGNFAIEPQFDAAYAFIEIGLAQVMQSDKKKAIDQQIREFYL